MKPKHLALSLVAACFALGSVHPVSAQNWTLTIASTNYDWQSITCSADGKTLAAAAYDDGFGDGGPIYSSTNFGAGWTLTKAPTNCAWQSIASSTNGSKLVAAVYQDANDNPGLLYASTNAGKTWAA